MPYTPQTWSDGSAGGTPLSAARLTVMETGIDTAHDLAAAAQAAADAAQATADAASSVAYAETAEAADALGVELVLIVSPAQLDPPTGLSVTGGDTQATLTWTATPDANADGQRVYRKVGAAAFALRTTVDDDAITFTDTGLTNGTVYQYYVVAYDSVTGRESTPTSTVSITPSGVINPLSLPWADAFWTQGPNFLAAVPADGAAVASWPNEVASRPAATQSTGASQPVYRASVTSMGNKPAVEFDGVDDILTVSGGGTLAQPFTVVMLLEALTTTDGSYFAIGTTSGVRGIGHQTGNWSNAWGVLATGLSASTGVKLLSGFGSGAASTLTSGASTQLVASDGGTTSVASRLIGGVSTVSRNKNFRLAFIGILGRALTTQERADLAAWAQTYGAAA